MYVHIPSSGDKLLLEEEWVCTLPRIAENEKFFKAMFPNALHVWDKPDMVLSLTFEKGTIVILDKIVVLPDESHLAALRVMPRDANESPPSIPMIVSVDDLNRIEFAPVS